MLKSKIVAIILIIILVVGCQKKAINVNLDKNWIHDCMQALSNTMVQDIFSPPVASRIYAYPSIAAYEVIASENKEYKSLAGQLNGLKPCPKPNAKELYNFQLSSVYAFLFVSKKLVFSLEEFELFEEKLSKEMEVLKIDQEIIERSKKYGEEVAFHILDWASKDNYAQTRSAEAYEIDKSPGKWQPTPPAYMPGIETHWSAIRTFVIDSVNQFKPVPPTDYSMDKNSQFYKEVMEVYETGNKLSSEQKAIASFWDCNPFVLHNKGHLMFGTKKITPGGHWIGITKIATKKMNYDFNKTLRTYALVSIGMADAFISCWDEKWRSKLIRPETVINQFIDEDWKPLLQTPPFPEYTSGHSVVSGSASTILTAIIGENFEYEDTSEIPYGLPSRMYKSFNQAAEEAAISRLYGGIHYMPAISNGLKQGRNVGNYILSKIQN